MVCSQTVQGDAGRRGGRAVRGDGLRRDRLLELQEVNTRAHIHTHTRPFLRGPDTHTRGGEIYFPRGRRPGRSVLTCTVDGWRAELNVSARAPALRRGASGKDPAPPETEHGKKAQKKKEREREGEFTVFQDAYSAEGSEEQIRPEMKHKKKIPPQYCISIFLSSDSVLCVGFATCGS